MKKRAAQKESEKTMWDSFLQAQMTFFNINSASQFSFCCGKSTLMKAGVESHMRVHLAEHGDAWYRSRRGQETCMVMVMVTVPVPVTVPDPRVPPA